MRQVLVIDDRPDICETIALTLSVIAHWQVRTTNNGAEGQRLAAQFNPDCILLDVMMPDLNGPGTLQLLKADPHTAHIPVIFLTSKAQASEQAKLQQCGAAGVLTKPFDPMLLGQQISSLLGWTL